MIVTKSIVCVFQAHYAVQARRSRSVTRKRKREESVPPSSTARSRSCSRTPRDVSGLRDVKVCFFDLGQIKIRTFRGVYFIEPPASTSHCLSRVVIKRLAVHSTFHYVASFGEELGPEAVGYPG